MWPLKPNHELIPILTFKVTQCRDLDHSGSRVVIVHLTIEFPVVISYRFSIGTNSVSPTVVEVMGPKYLKAMISDESTVKYYTHHPANRVQDITVLLIVIFVWNILPECVNFTAYNAFKQ